MKYCRQYGQFYNHSDIKYPSLNSILFTQIIWAFLSSTLPMFHKKSELTYTNVKRKQKKLRQEGGKG